MSSDDDPEVAADIARRDASERDPARTRGRGAYAWKAPVVAEQWPCALGCGAIVAVTREEIDAHAWGNEQAVSKGFPPIPRELPCAACKATRAPEVKPPAMRALEAYLPTPRSKRKPQRGRTKLL